MPVPPIKTRASGDIVIQLDAVSKRYGEAEALKGLSLVVRRGEFLTLLGPSGCGKTTTLRLISGFEVPDAGSVSIDGRDVTDVPPFHRDVNTVFQNYALFPHLTVFENVAYALRVKRIGQAEVRKRVASMLERVGLGSKADSYPRELSGGQRQRVALGRALINEPAVLLLDEPLSALDAKLRRAMQFELRRMHAELGLTFVCVTHDQEEALVMSDRIAVLDNGVIAQLGTPQEIFERPATRFVAEFIGGCNFFPALLHADGALVLNDGSGMPLGAQTGARPVPVHLAVRPRNLRLGPPGEDAAFAVEARVLDVVYLGTSVRLVLTLGGAIEFTAEVDHRGIDQPKAGGSVAVWARRDDTIIFDDSGRGSLGDH